MTGASNEVKELLDAYPAGVKDIALEARKFILTTAPQLEEVPDFSAKVIGYGFGPGYAGLVCTIILSKGGVKLGIVKSAELPDPNGLLGGNGKLHRYVMLSKPGDLRKAGLKQLVRAAVAAWKARAKVSG